MTRRVYSTRGSSNDRYTAEIVYRIEFIFISFISLFGFGLITMATPFVMGGHGAGTGSGGNQNSAQHGNAEQWTGKVVSREIGGRFGMTPPSSPRSTSPRTGQRNHSAPRRDRTREQSEDEARDRERDRRRRPARESEEQQSPAGWGARMLAAENNRNSRVSPGKSLRKPMSRLIK